MTNRETAPDGERDAGQDGRNDAEPPRYAQLRGDVDDAYGVLRKNSKTLDQHTKTLAKHGTSLRWIKRAQADHTVRLQRIEDRLNGVDTRFDGVDARFDGMDARLNSMDARFDSMDTRFNGMDARFDGMDTRFDGVDARLDGVERQLSELQTQLRSIIGLLGGKTSD